MKTAVASNMMMEREPDAAAAVVAAGAVGAVAAPEIGATQHIFQPPKARLCKNRKIFVDYLIHVVSCAHYRGVQFKMHVLLRKKL